jgi:hypothetical protein
MPGSNNVIGAAFTAMTLLHSARVRRTPLPDPILVALDTTEQLAAWAEFLDVEIQAGPSGVLDLALGDIGGFKVTISALMKSDRVAS